MSGMLAPTSFLRADEAELLILEYWNGKRKAREIARGLFVLLGNCLVLVLFGQVVDGVVQTTALLPFHRLLGDEVTDVDQVTQLADLA